MTSNAITSIIPAQQVQRLKAQLETVKVIRREVLAENIDFGVIPGTNKPTLLKPGAEKILNVLRLRPHYDALDKELNMESGFILYRYRCVVSEVDTGLEIGESIGSCNSFEKKYRYRWMPEHDVPSHLDKSTLVSRTSAVEEFDFAVDKKETTGKYGKPASYWQQFDDAIANGTAIKVQKTTRNGPRSAWRIETTMYQVPNPEIWDQLNTIDKMAQKRALVSAVLQAANVSDYFTVDIEDMPDFSEAYNSTIQVVGPDDVDKAREQVIEKLADAEEATVVEDEERTVPFPPSKQNVPQQDGPRLRDYGGKRPKRIEGEPGQPSRNMKQEPSTPQPEHWAKDQGALSDYLGDAVKAGLGETVGEAWAYISKNWPGGPLSGASGLPADRAEARRIMNKLARDLAANVGAKAQPDDDYWTQGRQDPVDPARETHVQ
jgi:hypothetical protein